MARYKITCYLFEDHVKYLDELIAKEDAANYSHAIRKLIADHRRRMKHKKAES